MPAWYKNAIQQHLEKSHLSYEELKQGAMLNEQEFNEVLSSSSSPRIDVIERICNWLGVSIADLAGTTARKEPTVINIQSLSVAGDFITGDTHISGGVRKNVTVQATGGSK